jgi:hypothetical protein
MDQDLHLLLDALPCTQSIGIHMFFLMSFGNHIQLFRVSHVRHPFGCQGFGEV